MIRHFFISENLTELVDIERELEQQGFSQSQIHLLSEQEAAVTEHQLSQVESILKKDIVHSTEIGAVVGVFAAALTLLIAFMSGWTQSSTGWLPFIFLAIIVLGFCTWEGGLIGIQSNNIHFEKFKGVLQKGKHLLFIDIEPQQEQQLATVVGAHPHLLDAGTGEAAPRWFVKSQDLFRRFVKSMP
ncbi:MAG: NAD/FAD-utilizing enzyme [Thalassotalea sp.]